MKLKDVAKGTWAVKAVPLRLANASQAAQPGQPPSGAPVTVQVGVRVLTGDETASVYQKAQELALEKGVPEWKAEHPLCLLYEKACTIALACVDADSDPRKPEPFFAEGVAEVLSSPLIGSDNIVYLHERWEWWQDECSFETAKMTAEEVIAVAMKHAEAPENESPLGRMRPGLRETYTRTLAVALSSLLNPKSLSTSPTGTSSLGSKSETQSESEAARGSADGEPS